MPVEEALPGSSKRLLSYSPSRSSASTRLFGVPPRRPAPQTSAVKKPPEPLRRAVADCLSPAAPHLHGNPSTLASEAARILRVSYLLPSLSYMSLVL
ncbi:hypothetical protein BHM03_00010129, partial [Ensete ventricosum]